MSSGTLFTEDFLQRGLVESAVWQSVDGQTFDAFRHGLTQILDAIADPAKLNEGQTEERIIRPMLKALGWDNAYSVQEKMQGRLQRNVPDYLLFADNDAFVRADEARGSHARLAHALAVGDAKAWNVGLDDQGSGAGKDETAAGQILRYLLDAEKINRGVQWAVLTSGRIWRLYHAGARSPLDGYYEADLADILARPGAQLPLSAADVAGESDAARRERLLKTFCLIFRRQSFLPQAGSSGASFHAYALDEGRKWETNVRTDLSETVFAEVFPGLIRALAQADRAAPKPLTPAYLATLREAALTVLYRLLFALYAEDRDLLPSRDRKYDDYSLSKIRDDIAGRLDSGDTFSERSARFWQHACDLFRCIDEGDASIGVPPYNGGLFARTRAPLLDTAPLPDQAFAPLLDKLSRTKKAGRLVRINYRDLSVRELGAIYERLLEREPVADASAAAGIDVRLNAFGRRNSGSYYTPDELVSLIVTRTIGPLIDERLAAFRTKLAGMKPAPDQIAASIAGLQALDPAERILDLKVCDPAMGSGHFLVTLIDHLALQAFVNLRPECLTGTWAQEAYVSPLTARLAGIRARIKAEADAHKWTIREQQLTDQNLIKRMVLKRCVYGVDKNPMAVELAKVALWLHTFTAGAPLSFLDHHLRCGDSLFGERVRPALEELQSRAGMFISDAIRKAEGGISGMEFVENLTDAEIAEVRASASAFDEVETATGPLRRALDALQAFKWLVNEDVKDKAMLPKRLLRDSIFGGTFGDVFDILSGQTAPAPPGNGTKNPEEIASRRRRADEAAALLDEAHALAAQEHFLHWQVAFPGVWRNWQSAEPEGGFDAVIGNPPWDRMKMQEVEWFAARAPNIARQARAADRKRMIAALKTANDPLAESYGQASALAEKAMERARRSGDYPLLSRGDINLYSLFVERAQSLIHKHGIAGLLTPSGIASDLTASVFFKGVAAAGRVMCLFDFENRRGEGRAHFFPDVDSRFKFCTFVVGGAGRRADAADCAFFLQDAPELSPPERLFRMTAADFALVNPNTGTAPIFRNQRDAALTTAIYRRLPVLVDRSSGEEVKTWPVKYVTMFHMANDSNIFLTVGELEGIGAYPLESGHWKKGSDEWVPLYEGKMVQAFDHRAADIKIEDTNTFRPGQPDSISEEDHADPMRFATPRFFVARQSLPKVVANNWLLAFKDVTSSTNASTFIAALIPAVGAGHTLPLMLAEIIGTEADADAALKQRLEIACSLVANFNSYASDFVVRQKVHTNHLVWFIIEQLPFIPPAAYTRAFGTQTAAQIVKHHVLRLTYTAWDMEPFARDMGYAGDPFKWDDQERRHLRARLDALYFHLYGITDEADIRYILSTFPIVERKDRAAHQGVYLTAELIIWYFRALAAGDPDGQAPEAVLIRNARRGA